MVKKGFVISLGLNFKLKNEYLTYAHNLLYNPKKYLNTTKQYKNKEKSGDEV